MNIRKKEVSFFTIILQQRKSHLRPSRDVMVILQYTAECGILDPYGFRKMDIWDQHNYRIIQNVVSVFSRSRMPVTVSREIYTSCS